MHRAVALYENVAEAARSYGITPSVWTAWMCWPCETLMRSGGSGSSRTGAVFH